MVSVKAAPLTFFDGKVKWDTCRNSSLERKLRMSDPVKTITPKEVEKLLDDHRDVSLIDVREDEEIAEGKIPQARHIRLGLIPERLDEIEKDKQHILICRSGNRSEYACRYLQSLGYDVVNMVGGMLEWEGDIK